MDRIPKILGPAQFREIYAPHMSIGSVRALWHNETFPGFRVGTSMAVVDTEVEKWLNESTRGLRIKYTSE